MLEKFDIIIIGSGAGGLTAASFAAKNGYKVLVCERHIVPGGYLHGFKRRGYFFDSAVYSIAGCGENGYVKFLLDRLGVSEELKFLEYQSIYRILLPHGTYVLPTGIGNFKKYLSGLFPEESENLSRMMEEMKHLYDTMELEKFGQKPDEKERTKILQKWGRKSYKEFIDSFIEDSRLRDIFYSLWLFCVLPENRASSLFSVLMLMIHIVEGTHYVEGGCDNLAGTLAGYVGKNNGVVRYSSQVEKITMDGGIATGVVLSDGTSYEADVVIANCNAIDVIRNMIQNTDAVSGVVRRRIEKLVPAISTFAIYMAARTKSGVSSPFSDANQIFYLEGTDNDRIYESCLDDGKDPFQNILITEIPGEHKDGMKTFNVYSLMSFDRTGDWSAVKKRLTDMLLLKVRKILGDYLEEVVVLESATPATFRRYTLNEKGSMYGFENTNDPYKGMKLDNKTGIPNLFLAGHWTLPGGSVYNAMTSGYQAFEFADEYLKKKADIS
jgi:all-trans-retinol 13,14-reductase